MPSGVSTTSSEGRWRVETEGVGGWVARVEKPRVPSRFGQVDFAISLTSLSFDALARLCCRRSK